MINEEETFRLFGYYSTDLKPKSHKNIVAVCDNPKCEGNKVRIIQKDRYKSLCKSCVLKNRWNNLIKRKELIESITKGWEDPLSREKARKGQLKRYEDPSEREKRKVETTKRFEDPLEREKVRQQQLKRYEDPLEHDRSREAYLKYANANPEKVKSDGERAGLASVKSQHGKTSSIEFKIRKILIDNNYQFITNTPLYNMCIPDIVFKNEKVIIQCDGDYWHDYPNGLEKDHKQDKILKANGWQVMRFWEHEINNDISGCLERFEWETMRRFHDRNKSTET